MELFTLPGEGEGVIRAIYSFYPPAVETEHMVKDENGNMILDTKGDVLLGKMGFKLLNEEGTYDITKFALVENPESAPKTGININMDGIYATNSHYEAQSTFRFTEGTKDLSLNNITVSNTKTNEEDPDNPIYKEYELTPEFNKDTLEYETTILEYIDDVDVKVKKSDENAKLKIKVPKRDENGELEYEEDGTTIKYEEKEMQDNTPINVILNKLGEPDTKITIIVLTEDESEKNEYTVNIKRPYGTIQGSIQLGSDIRESTESSYGNTIQYIANITAYKTGIFNWDGILAEETFLEELDDIKEEVRVQSEGENGKYTMYIIPGQYDLILERLGYLANVTTEITINEGDVIDMGDVILTEGDINRSGIVDLDDIVDVLNAKGITSSDAEYEERYDYGQKGYVALDDIIWVLNSKGNYITINKYV